MKKRIMVIVLVVLTVMINIALDQGTKYLARENIKNHGRINVIHTFFILQYAENDGGFLGLGSGIPQPFKTIVLIIFPVIMVTGLLIYLIIGKNLTLLHIVSISCILGGGISNIYDRLAHNGFVTDFLNFGIGNIRTGILNVADLSITFGVIFLLIIHLIHEKKVKDNNVHIDA
ncbi:MAG: signal peptidase II [Spirochaetales bacterium]|nr:signal peptidase II [Spirochaetales bacterium]